MVSLVLSRLDYYNVKLIGKSPTALHNLPVIQNYAAIVITGLGMQDHVTPALHELHWLPVHQRVRHKVLSTLYGALSSDDAPVYLRDTVTRRVVRRTLRSGSALHLSVPRTNSRTLADLCFSVAAPTY